MMMFTFLPMTKIVAKVVAVDLQTLAQTYMCSICKVSVSIENGLAWCNNCNNVQDKVNLNVQTCKLKAYLELSVLKDGDQSRLQMAHSIIERKFDLSLQILHRKS